jgi:prolyl-tRNA synthetase
LVDITEEELAHAGLIAGYMGPTVVPEGISVVFDNSLKDASSMICGANEKDHHLIGNSFVGVEADYYDLVAVQEGDLCSCCGEPMRYTKGIEAGHIFQLGTQYSEPLGANFLDENGKAQPMVMGTYGIGVSRLLAAIIEQNHDDKGCIWTKESAPFDLQIIISNIKDEEQVALGEKLYALMLEKGVDVLLDERKDRFGAKMKDYELLGVPHAVVIGKKLSDGLVEFVTREGMQKDETSVADIEDLLLERF